MTPAHDSLMGFMTIEEAADELELAPGSIRRMITEKRLAARHATLDECADLLAARRIHGVPGTGVRLIHHDAIASAKQRSKRGRPASTSPG